MNRRVLLSALVACGARTDLGGVRGDASIVVDAGVDADVVDASSKCPPVEYVNDDQSSTVFAIDDAALYFVRDPCEVARVTKDGTPDLALTMGSDCAGEIIVGDEDVFWTSAAGHAMKRLKDGSPGIGDLGCAALNGCPGNVHVRAVTKDVLVLVDGFRPVAMATEFPSLPYPLIPTGFAPPAPVHYVFVDDARAYWNTDIRVFSAPLDGTALPLQYATSSNGLAVDTAHVYWTAHDGAAFDLFRANKDASGVTTLSTSDTSTPLVANDTFVYGVSPGGITRQPTSGGSPTLIVPNVHPLTLALDDACIYFAEKTANGRRIARAPN